MTQQKQPNQATRIVINDAAAKAALGAESNTLTLHLGEKAIAKRGAPGSKDAGKWVPLKSGYVVRDDPTSGELVVEFDNLRIH